MNLFYNNAFNANGINNTQLRNMQPVFACDPVGMSNLRGFRLFL